MFHCSRGLLILHYILHDKLHPKQILILKLFSRLHFKLVLFSSSIYLVIGSNFNLETNFAVAKTTSYIAELRLIFLTPPTLIGAVFAVLQICAFLWLKVSETGYPFKRGYAINTRRIQFTIAIPCQW